jgi:hypothetical protein
VIPYPLGGQYPLGLPDPRIGRWRAESDPRRSERPAPVVVIGASSPRADQTPRGALAVIRAAQGAGWDVQATYALAEVPAWTRILRSGERRPQDSEVVESLALRLRAPGGKARGVALWCGGRFDVAWLVEPGGSLARYGARALAERLRSS